MQFFKRVVNYTDKDGQHKKATRLYIRRNEKSYPIEITTKWDSKRDWWELVEIAEEME